MAVQMFRKGNIEFELMQPASPQSIIAQFLKKRGEGLHHLAFEVEDIAEAMKGERGQAHYCFLINNGLKRVS